MDLPGDIKYYVYLIIVMFFWGITWVSMKILVSLAPVITIAFFRYAVAIPFFIILLRQRGKSPWQIFRKNTTRIVAIAGLIGIFGSVVVRLYGLQYTTAGQAAILAGISPITVSLFAHIINKERLSREWQYSGFIISFIGVIFVVGVQSLLEFNFNYLIGNIIIIISVAMWGIYSSVNKRAMQELTPVEATAGSIFVGWLPLSLGVLTELDSLANVLSNPEFLLNVFFIGVITAFLGFTLYFESINEIGATRSGAFISLVPIFGTLMSLLLLQEVVYWTFIVGLFLVVFGILILNAPFVRNGENQDH